MMGGAKKMALIQPNTDFVINYQLMKTEETLKSKKMTDINNANRYLFRGKRIDNGGWVEGSLISGFNGDSTRAFIFNGEMVGKAQPLEFGCEVDPSTVGQWTGVEIDQKKIFGGDILKGVDKYYEVLYKDGCWWAISTDTTHWVFHLYDCMDMTLVDNIHDNPDLLK